jgi:hypothetical protein
VNGSVHNRLRAVLPIVAGVCVLVSATPASAVPTLTLSESDGNNQNGGNNQQLTLPSNAAGLVSFSGTLGSFSLSIATSPVTGQAMLPLLSLSLSYSGLNPGTLTISLSDTSFSPTGGTLVSQISGLTSGGSVSYSTFADTGNSLFGKGTLLGTLGAFTGGNFAGTASATLSSQAPFSLTEMFVIQQGKGGTTSFGAVVNDPPAAGVVLVPESGSTIALLGLALLTCELLRRKLTAA